MTKDLVKADNWSNEQLELITNTVAKGATKEELQLFLYTSKRTGLDPLTKQIHFVKRWDSKAGKEVGAIQTGIDGYRAIAERTGTLAGIDDAVYDTENEPHPNKASVTVYRLIKGTRVGFTASARWAEYAQTYFDKRIGKQNYGPMWKKMPYLMLAKCAEALALRKAFPNDLSGIYTNEEMSQADSTYDDGVVHNTIKPEPQANQAPVKQEQPSEEYEPMVYEPINYDVTDDDIAEVDNKPLSGEVMPPDFLQNEPQQDDRAYAPKMVCPICGKEHTGQYPKCYDCWRSGNNTKTKTLINDKVKPF